MDSQSSTPPSERAGQRSESLSYKFQRLRERLRDAVASGELSGKLPGERALAKRFNVNAKTLSKALTDLAAEGLLDRSIGRGTYVKGSVEHVTEKAMRWLIVCDADRSDSFLSRQFQEANPESTLVHDVNTIRPSFLRQFDAVIDFAIRTPDAFLRDLVVRNIPVVAVNREPDIYSVNTVGPDRAMGAGYLARDLILGGHRHIAVIESLPRSVAGGAVKLVTSQYCSDCVVEVGPREELSGFLKAGVTAVVCDSTFTATEVRRDLEAAGISIGNDISLGAVGACDGNYPCSGYFVDTALLAQTVVKLVQHGTGTRPSLIWLAPRFVDQGSIKPLKHVRDGEAA